MKKYFFNVLLLALSIQCRAQATVVTEIYSSHFCAGDTFNITFTANGDFGNSNVFNAVLSNATGSFTDAVIIGTFSAGLTGGTIAVSIPENTVSGNMYRIKVVNSSISVISTDNGFNLTINGVPTPKLLVSGSACAGIDSLKMSTIGSISQVNWYEVGNNIPVFVTPPVTYQSTIVAGGNGQGSNANQLSNPSDARLDATGNLYVCDWDNNRIQRFPPGSTSATNGVTVAGGNGEGNAPDQLFAPTTIFIDGNNNLYVADQINDRIQQFPFGSTSATTGTTIAGGNGLGDGNSQLFDPIAVYVDGTGDLYVMDCYNFRVQKFSVGSSSVSIGLTIAGGNGQGSAADQFGGSGPGLSYGPMGVFVDGAGEIYVSDYGNNRVLKFANGSTSVTDGVIVAGGNGPGSAANQLHGPGGIFLDCGGNLYVVDRSNSRVQKFPAGSTSVTDGLTLVTGDFVGNSAGIYVDDNGNFYLSGSENTGVQKYTLTNPSPYYIPPSAGTYAVQYISGAGCTSVLSNTVNIKDCASGINDLANSSEVKLYPNPNTGSFTLETSNSIGNEFMVYDMIGNMIMHQTITSDKQVIILKGVSAGTYTLQIKGAENRIRFTVYE